MLNWINDLIEPRSKLMLLWITWANTIEVKTDAELDNMSS